MSQTENKISRIQASEIIQKYQTILDKNNINHKVCGSWRRHKEEIGDLDIVVTDCSINDLLFIIKNVYPYTIVRSGDALLSLDIVFENKTVRVEFITVPLDSFGSACIHATGNAQFNISLRTYCKNKGFEKLNQYGLFKNGISVASKTENDVFEKLGLDVIPPECRSDFWKTHKSFKRN
jgi:DNA polymerase (family 10)